MSAAMLCVACASADPVLPEDRDGDGLTDEEEAGLGSDPDAADTDLDGWDDGIEVASNTDPLDGYDHPYKGGWAIDACRHDLVGEGAGLGQVVPAFVLTDQHGELVRLHDFCDRVIVIASVTEWCGPCAGTAGQLGRMYDAHADDGLMVVVLLVEDVNHRTPTVAQLAEFAGQLRLQYPVLRDAGFGMTMQLGGRTGEVPMYFVIDRGAVMRSAGTSVTSLELALDLL